MKIEIAGLKEGIENLKNSTIMNQRVKLLSNPVSINLPVTNWEEGDFANIQLSDSIKNYKYLEIQFDYGILVNLLEERTEVNTKFIAIEQFNCANGNNWENYNANFVLNQSFSDASVGIWCWFKNEKLLHIDARWNAHNSFKEIRIRNIYGIK